MSGGPTQKLTDQQARPLAVRGASVALSAGAGCGKTTVLTARFLRELERPGGRSLRSIVALTFTDKAARELRGRIRAECRKRLGHGDNAPYWRAVLRALEAAPVGTFHEFCGAWLRRHALEARLDPDFGVLDANIAAAIREDALARAVRRKLSQKDDDLILLAAEFGMRAVREALAVLLARRDADALEDWVRRAPEEIVALWREVWDSREKPLAFEAVRREGEAVAALLSDLEFAHAKLAELRRSLLAALPALADLADDDGGLARLREQALLPRGLRATHWPSADVNEAVKGSLARFRGVVDDYRARCRWSEPAALTAAKHGLRFARLALAARDEYARAKRERGGLDFDDLLIKTRDLLHAADVTARAELADAIELLLVDEFQDTDPVQSDILRLLTGTGYLDGRLFVVGDFKQSIYRFRGAEPKIFQRVRADFPGEGRHDLTENFRSVPGVLDFVNALFRDAFADEDVPPLTPGRAVAEGDSSPAVEFVWASEPESAVKDEKGKVPVREARRIEARWLARHLRRLIAAGRLVRDRETGAVRPVRAGDVALLFRAMTDVAPYETALRDEGLDYYTVGGSAFYVQQEINDLINVLSAIEDPYDAVGLAGALRGPFFGLSDDGLYWLATARRDITEGVSVADEIAGLSGMDRDRALRARRLLERWRGLKDRLPMAALIDRVLEESGYEAALLAEPFGDRKRANARKLVRMARDYDRQGGFTLAQFVAGLRAQLRDPSREEQAATTDETGDCVRLMSVHAAKGLEFPVVVLPDLNRKASAETPCAAFDQELGPLVRASRERDGLDEAEDEEGLGWRIFRARERREEEAEALRLFYVATTRARDVLILSAPVAPSEPVQAAALRLLDARFDRATGLCRQDLPAGWPAPHVAIVNRPPETTHPTGRSKDTRPTLHDVARIIDDAVGAPSLVVSTTAPRARSVDLDPARWLTPADARRDRLIRAILADPRDLTVRSLPDAARRAGRKQVPAAYPALIEQAVERLRPWVDGALSRILARAQKVESGRAWTVAWPPDSRDPTVFHGRIDLLFQEHEGAWGIVQFSDVAVPEPSERLRTLLSGHAATMMGYQPLAQAWQICLGPDGRLVGEERFDASTIEAALGVVSALSALGRT